MIVSATAGVLCCLVLQSAMCTVESPHADVEILETMRSCTKNQTLIEMDGVTVKTFIDCVLKAQRSASSSGPSSEDPVLEHGSLGGVLGSDIIGMSEAELRDILGLPSRLAASIAVLAALPAQSTSHAPIDGADGGPARMHEQAQCRSESCQSGGLFWSPASEEDDSSRHARRSPCWCEARLKLIARSRLQQNRAPRSRSRAGWPSMPVSTTSSRLSVPSAPPPPPTAAAARATVMTFRLSASSGTLARRRRGKSARRRVCVCVRARDK